MTENNTSVNLKPIDSADDVKQFFNNYFVEPISYSSNKVDSVVGFFENRGFDTQSAVGVATVLLQQAKIDDINVFTLLDTLKGATDVEISSIVTEILNNNRPKSSSLGFKSEQNIREESRNIVV